MKKFIFLFAFVALLIGSIGAQNSWYWIDTTTNADTLYFAPNLADPDDAFDTDDLKFLTKYGSLRTVMVYDSLTGAPAGQGAVLQYGAGDDRDNIHWYTVATLDNNGADETLVTQTDAFVPRWVRVYILTSGTSTTSWKVWMDFKPHSNN